MSADPSTRPLAFASADDSEELARAELYGLLARLWHAPPDADLLQQFAVAVTQAPQPDGFLQGPWEDLVAALRATTPATAAEAFDALFGGVGKPEIFAFGSHHLAGFLNERPLALLRQDLAVLGLSREEGGAFTEDHIAFEFEVMRWLIAGDDVALCNLESQRSFFRAHLQPWVETLCTQVAVHPRAQWLAALAGFTAAFMQVEAQAFDMIE